VQQGHDVYSSVTQGMPCHLQSVPQCQSAVAALATVLDLANIITLHGHRGTQFVAMAICITETK